MPDPRKSIVGHFRGVVFWEDRSRPTDMSALENAVVRNVEESDKSNVQMLSAYFSILPPSALEDCGDSVATIVWTVSRESITPSGLFHLRLARERHLVFGNEYFLLDTIERIDYFFLASLAADDETE